MLVSLPHRARMSVVFLITITLSFKFTTQRVHIKKAKFLLSYISKHVNSVKAIMNICFSSRIKVIPDT